MTTEALAYQEVARVIALYRYPVKSMRGNEVARARRYLWLTSALGMFLGTAGLTALIIGEAASFG